MAGHSKWANIKFRKERQDARKGKIFTRLIKEITISARNGGGDPNTNPRLRTAIQAGKLANMPMKNIENAIKKGTGELPGVVYEEIIYEGYGPGGVALYIECTTDNKNRTVSEIRHILSKYGGNLGEYGCVAWIFKKKGLIQVPKVNYDEEELMLLSIDAGAEDFDKDDDTFLIYSVIDDLEMVQAKLNEAGIQIKSSDITFIPQTTVYLDGREAEHMLNLMEALEDNDDVKNVYANFDIDEDIMEKI
jgi:YebC/PmpR family DNA-binding regulatory protein